MGEQAAMQRLEEWLKDAAWGCYFPPGGSETPAKRVEIEGSKRVLGRPSCEASTRGTPWAAASAPTRPGPRC